MAVELSRIRKQASFDPNDNTEGYENVGFQSDPRDSGVSQRPMTEKPRQETAVSVGPENGKVPEDTFPSPGQSNKFYIAVHKAETKVTSFVKKYKKIIKWTIIAILLILYFVYLGYAIYHKYDEGAKRLVGMTVVVVAGVIIYQLYTFINERMSDETRANLEKIYQKEELMAWIVVSLLLVSCVLYVFIDALAIRNQPYNLVSFIGIFGYILLLWVTSTNPGKVRWRPVVWGMALQLLFGLLILRWEMGYLAFKWLGDRVTEFLAHTDAGSSFVFGAKYTDHFFAFKVLTVVIFFSTAISVLYYLGVMQAVIKGLASVMRVTMGTTPAESLNAAGNIFVGMSEAPLMIRPLLQKMTNSELHSVMTGGFATIAGSVFAAYVGFNVPANHLISASVMSAPAALAMSKLSYPETEKVENYLEGLGQSTERNVIEAASNGASKSISLVANIAANLIAFLAMLSFINATLCWFGQRVGIGPPNYPCLSLEFVFSYVLWPFALIMGVEPADCRKVAEMMGIKTVLNEFVAYNTLGKIIRNTETANAFIANATAANITRQINGDNLVLRNIYTLTNVTLEGGVLSPRSQVISTYALCGFANIGSIGITLGALGAMVPKRRRDLSNMAFRAMVAGNVACFMTACIAGLLYIGN